MTTNDTGSQESVGASPSIAHSVCHDCDDHEELHPAKRPEDAKQMAVEDAIEHGRATGHEVDEELIAEPDMISTCGPDVQDSEVLRR